MAQTSPKKRSEIKEFWKKYFDGKDKVSSDDFQQALIQHLEEQAGEEKEKEQTDEEKEKEQTDKDKKKKLPAYNKDKECRRLFAKGLANQVFWPVEGGKGFVTVASIIFACKKNNFGPWPTLFQTIFDNLYDADPSQQLQTIDFFYGRSDFESLQEKLKNTGSYCLRYHDDGGLELCFHKMSKSGSEYKREKIERKKFKNKPVQWRWEQSVAQIGGSKIVTHDFANVRQLIKHLKEKKVLLEPVMGNSAYKTMQGGDKKKPKGQLTEEEKIMKSMGKK